MHSEDWCEEHDWWHDDMRDCLDKCCFRLNCPETDADRVIMRRDMDDPKTIARIIEEAANTVSGKNEHGLAYDMWALAARVRKCMSIGHRYVRCSSRRCRQDNLDLPAIHCSMHQEHK